MILYLPLVPIVFVIIFYILLKQSNRYGKPLWPAVVFTSGLTPSFIGLIVGLVAISMGGAPSFLLLSLVVLIYVGLAFVFPIWWVFNNHINNGRQESRFLIRGFGKSLGISILGVLIFLFVMNFLQKVAF